MFEVKKVEGAERPHSRPYLLYVGLRGGYKNFEGLLRAVAASPMLRADYDVIAFGGGSFRSSETAMISQLGFGDGRVLQMGGGDSLLGELYAHADAFVYPSAYEGFGFPPLEAMTQGCPVVASNTSSMPEVIGDAGEFFDPGSVEDIRRAIEAVVYSRDRGQELVRLGYARIKMFSWEKCASETMAVYRSLQ
jgi:glycosyltransferase involved in cell wall biosynthesis